MIYINDFQKFQGCSNFIYADDIAIFCKQTNVQSLKQSLENALYCSNRWYLANNISPNLEKTELLVQNDPSIPQDFSVICPGNEMQINMSTTPVRYLGVWISRNDKFDLFFHQIIKRMTNRI